MSRTTYAAVAKIIELGSVIVPDADALAPFIEVANSIVTNACLNPTNPLYVEATDATVLELIERWLAAHCYAIRDPRTTSEKVGSLGESYEGKQDLYLASTRYGQMAMMVDTRGGLAALNRMPQFASKLKVGITYLGTNPPNAVIPQQ